MPEHKRVDEQDSSEWETKALEPIGLAALTKEVRKGFEALKTAMHEGDIRFVTVESQLESLGGKIEELDRRFGSPGELSIETRISLGEREGQSLAKQIGDVNEEVKGLRNMLWGAIVGLLLELIGGVVGFILAMGRGGH